jgi:hypothetical protein
LKICSRATEGRFAPLLHVKDDCRSYARKRHAGEEPQSGSTDATRSSAMRLTLRCPSLINDGQSTRSKFSSNVLADVSRLGYRLRAMLCRQGMSWVAVRLKSVHLHVNAGLPSPSGAFDIRPTTSIWYFGILVNESEPSGDGVWIQIRRRHSIAPRHGINDSSPGLEITRTVSVVLDQVTYHLWKSMRDGYYARAR